jgi:hypothetical protein
MWLMRMVFSVSILAAMFSGSASADTPPPAPEPTGVLECLTADGDTIYTNKERPGCRVMMLRPLSVVPSLDNMPIVSRPAPVAAPHYEVPAYQDRPSGMGGRNVPDWAREWHASTTGSGSVQGEVCGLYMEWLQLVQKTRGGLWFGSDPSYGGDLSGRNQRGASYSFYDNARYVTLSDIFGRGFIPIGCP